MSPAPDEEADTDRNSGIRVEWNASGMTRMHPSMETDSQASTRREWDPEVVHRRADASMPAAGAPTAISPFLVLIERYLMGLPSAATILASGPVLSD